MKVLYIGHYKEFGGWATAAQNYILALDSVGVDVVCRNVTLTRDRQISGRLAELENKSTDDCDICIQHVLPHHLVGTQTFKKNIAFLATESVSIKHLGWFNYLQQMDSLWVPNSQSKEFLEADDLGIPISVVPHTFDISKYSQQVKPLDIPHLKDKFIFYYVGDMNDRKNLESVITCFHSEFDKSEDAALLIKVNKFGKNPQELQQIVEAKIHEVKSKLRMYQSVEQYSKDLIITTELSNEDLASLHKSCDCLLCPSHGEAWSIPAFDAMAMGNRPICSNFGGPKEFITDDEATGKLIDGVYASCKCSDAAFPDIFTGREYWFVPCEKQMRLQMRKYYELYKENPIEFKLKSQLAGLENSKKFSFEQIGNQMKEILND